LITLARGDMAETFSLPSEPDLSPFTSMRNTDPFNSIPPRDSAIPIVIESKADLRKLFSSVQRRLSDQSEKLRFITLPLRGKREYWHRFSNTELFMAMMHLVFFNDKNFNTMVTTWIKHLAISIESVLTAVWTANYAFRFDRDNIYFFPPSIGSSLGIPLAHLDPFGDMRLYAFGEILRRVHVEEQPLFAKKEHTLDWSIIMYSECAYDSIISAVMDRPRLCAKLSTAYILVMPTAKHALQGQALVSIGNNLKKGTISSIIPLESTELKALDEMTSIATGRQSEKSVIANPSLDVTSFHRFIYPDEHITSDKQQSMASSGSIPTVDGEVEDDEDEFYNAPIIK
jgi:hypothetical protein